jgi:hypothetical protein
MPRHNKDVVQDNMAKARSKVTEKTAPQAPPTPLPPTPQQGPRRIGRSAAWIALVAGGIVLAQFLLLGPSLFGSKVLLSLDILTLPGTYIPVTDRSAVPKVHDRILSDLVLQDEMNQQFAVSEIHAGRWPLWTPNQFCGTPFTGYPKYSPFKIPAYCSSSLRVYAWVPLCVAVFTGLGAYFFCRRVLLVGVWPATIAAWCWPLTGFFVFWTGYNLPLSACWLPWILWTVNATVRRSSRWAGIWLALATCLTIISGQYDVAGMVLLVAGLFALWCFIDEYGRRCFTRQVVPPLASLAAGWGLGFLMASVWLLPMLEYSRGSSRMERRSEGELERPPIGPEALPQMVLPDMYGASREGNLAFFPKNQGNQLESSAAAYTGLLATVLLMPLAWYSRRHRSMNVLWTAVGILGASWCLDLPVIVDLMKLPGVNMLSYNRFVLATSFAILAMAAVGLDVLWQGNVERRWWFWAPMSLAAVLLLWSLYRAAVLPEPLATKWEQYLKAGGSLDWVHDVQKDLWPVQDAFVRSYAVAIVLSALGVAGWLRLWYRAKLPRWSLPVLATVLLADLLWFAYGRPAQCDPALYYPRIPALEQIAKGEPGRIMGAKCLPAILGQSHNLRDVRGYDGVDPAAMVELLRLAADPKHPSPMYATTQWLVPMIGFSSATEIRLHPVMNMLGVRYVIFRGNPPPELRPQIVSPDYWVMVNHRALPRVYVPEHVEVASGKEERLTKLAALDFDPRRVAYVKQSVDLPDKCRGTAKIMEETPDRIDVSLDMQTPGLLVLADRWDAGWQAYYDGKLAPILPVNHAVRGVEVPAGKATLEFRYEPAGFALGLRLCELAAAALIVWAGGIVWMSHRRRQAAL